LWPLGAHRSKRIHRTKTVRWRRVPREADSARNDGFVIACRDGAQHAAPLRRRTQDAGLQARRYAERPQEHRPFAAQGKQEGLCHKIWLSLEAANWVAPFCFGVRESRRSHRVAVAGVGLVAGGSRVFGGAVLRESGSWAPALQVRLGRRIGTCGGIFRSGRGLAGAGSGW
jgi:hypothetical protein